MKKFFESAALKCDGRVFENEQTLVEYAKNHIQEFVVYSGAEPSSISINGEELLIKYTIEDFDENDQDITSTLEDSFPVEKIYIMSAYSI